LRSRIFRVLFSILRPFEVFPLAGFSPPGCIMSETAQFLLRHGGLVLFGVVLVEQVGLPLPAVPFLLAAGALIGAGGLNPLAALGLPILASLLGDSLWYILGRRRGMEVLNWLCRISLEPDSCVRRTENVFLRHGVRSLLIAKFVPGLATVSPPLAGVFGARTARFLLYDGLGALLYAGTFVGVGHLFSSQLEGVVTYTVRMGSVILAGVVMATAGYIVFKILQRQRLMRRLRVTRIVPDELCELLDGGHKVSVLDLRNALTVKAAPYAIRGAIRMTPEEVERRQHEIPRDRDIVLYCS
jgi:membrane protein DedA with SNARE-associated domain